MRLCYKALLDIYDEIEEEMVKDGKEYQVPYAKEVVSSIKQSLIISLINNVYVINDLFLMN